MLDEIDREIIAYLTRNSRIKYTDLGRRLHLSEGAVRHRIQRLVSQGIIAKFTIEFGEKARFLRAFIEIRLDGRSSEHLVEFLSEQPPVCEINEIAGDTDLLVKVQTETPEELNQLINKIQEKEGVVRTRTLLVLKRFSLSSFEI